MKNQNPKSKNIQPEKVEIQNTTPKSGSIRLLKNPTGFTQLANNEGDVVSLSPELTKKLVDAGYAEFI